MSVLVDRRTRVLTQGITGATGQLHTRLCREYGTQMVAGVTLEDGFGRLRICCRFLVQALSHSPLSGRSQFPSRARRQPLPS